MATMAAAARDTLQDAPMSRDNLTVVAARSMPATVTRSQALPTPPNSISPALPPHGLKAQLQKAKLEPIDSDLDLHEARDGSARRLSPSFDSAGSITPQLLAKHHLPEILLNHGPLAIRHIMGYLTTSVPGFAGIPPAKARRLVVGAMEGRGGDGGGVNGDVEFEKVGWGRWDARRRGHPSRRASTPPEQDYSSAIPIGKSAIRGPIDRSRLDAGSSDAGHSLVYSHDDRHDLMMEDEADKMSLDGSASASCSEAPDDDDMAMDDPDDMTDDEDWAAVGAAGLRAESYAAQSGRSFLTSVHSPGCMRAVSTGMARSPQPFNLDFSALAATSDAQERDAVEALLRLGSV
ncbi:putative Sin3 binding protein-domain-containing protein [Plectosphaerella plurivora]|uniref:Sin3 binding protein-domain-containing protein n=1 Tax=Plectosphaerella plurivora TaxID=936078 RepID=A0A9P8VB58_9PEZI|nr:putative Sin3 binding protein-domain-containing protein [Plectosphaerella plurivora]